MANLTKGYFDQQLKKLASKKDLEQFVTKKDLAAALSSQTKELKDYTEEKVGELAGMVARRFDDLERKLDVKADVDQLKDQMKKVWDALAL